MPVSRGQCRTSVVQGQYLKRAPRKGACGRLGALLAPTQASLAPGLEGRCPRMHRCGDLFPPLAEPPRPRTRRRQVGGPGRMWGREVEGGRPSGPARCGVWGCPTSPPAGAAQTPAEGPCPRAGPGRERASSSPRRPRPKVPVPVQAQAEAERGLVSPRRSRPRERPCPRLGLKSSSLSRPRPRPKGGPCPRGGQGRQRAPVPSKAKAQSPCPCTGGVLGPSRRPLAAASGYWAL
nr:translation initiation factor IF-2-like [Chlorocebus sabaeus]